MIMKEIIDKNGSRRIALLLACFVALVSTIAVCALSSMTVSAESAFAEEDAASQQESENVDGDGRRVIRIAFPQQNGLTETDDDGTRSGYTFEYLEQIAQQTGWRYEYVTVEGDINEQLVAMLDMLESGEVDIMGAMSYSDALAEVYDFAIKPYGYAHTALFAADGNTAITNTNVYELDHATVATNGPSPTSTAELKTFCAMNGIELDIIQADSSEDAVDLVVRGEADLALGVDISPLPGLHPVATFTPKPFYFATTKGNKEIVASMNEAIASIDSAEPQLQSSLYDKYFGIDETVYGLSDDMKSYIEQQGTTRVGYFTGEAPIQDADEETGELVGAAKGALDYVSEYTGLSFEAVAIPNGMPVDEAIEALDLDMVAGVSHDYELARERNLALSTPYLRSLKWLVVRNGVDASDLSGKRIAVAANRAAAEGRIEDSIVYDTVQECFDAVDRGEADYTYADGYIAPFYISGGQYRNITALAETGGVESNVCFAVPASSDTTLLKILNKAIQVMPTGATNTSIYGQVTQMQKMTPERFVKDFAIEIIVVSLILAAIIIALLVLYARARSKALTVVTAEKDQLEMKAERDDLTGLLGVGTFRDRAREMLARGEAGAFIVVDIDDFKLVNDTLGHRKGDDTLVALADSLRQAFRNDDLLCRLGGDEFAICVRGSIDSETLERRCSALQDLVEKSTGSLRSDYSVSIGATLAHRSDRYADLYDRADKAMYYAKRNGKNSFHIE